MTLPDYRQLATQDAQKYGIPANLFVNQINAESGFNPAAHSGAGAQGIAQIMPNTARGWGVNPNDPVAALDAAARAMAKYTHSYGGYRNALVAYNAGPGRVGKPLYAETAAYVNKIMGGAANRTPMPNAANPAAIAASTTPRMTMQKFDPVKLSEDQMRTLAGDDSISDPGSMVQLTNQSRKQGVDDYNAKAQAYNQSLDAKAAQAVASGDATAASDTASKSGWNGQGSPFAFLEHRFGLQTSSSDHDAAGVHVNGSYHYQKAPWGGVEAYDFGDARNSDAKLRAAAEWAIQHPQGIKEMFWDPFGSYIKNGKIIRGSIGGHGDHLHIAY